MINKEYDPDTQLKIDKDIMCVLTYAWYYYRYLITPDPISLLNICNIERYIQHTYNQYHPGVKQILQEHVLLKGFCSDHISLLNITNITIAEAEAIISDLHFPPAASREPLVILHIKFQFWHNLAKLDFVNKISISSATFSNWVSGGVKHVQMFFKCQILRNYGFWESPPTLVRKEGSFLGLS